MSQPAGSWQSMRERALLTLEREKSAVIRAEAAEAICDAAADAPDDALPDFAADVVRLLNDKQEEVRCAGLALASEVLAPAEAKDLLIRNIGDKAHRVRVERAFDDLGEWDGGIGLEGDRRDEVRQRRDLGRMTVARLVGRVEALERDLDAAGTGGERHARFLSRMRECR